MPCSNIRVRAHRRKGTKGVKAHERTTKHFQVGDRVLIKSSGKEGRITQLHKTLSMHPIQVLRDDGYEYNYPRNALKKIR